jgi:hypothetical protein
MTRVELGLPDHLDRSRLNFFVIGSGFGEAILVAIPDAGWLVIDGAGPTTSLPALDILRRYIGEDAIELLLLTHPHRDHFYGFIELLDSELGRRVQRIGCVAEYAGETTTLSREVEAAFESLDRNDPAVWAELGRARSVLERIATEWRGHPTKRFQARRGARLTFGDVEIEVLSPAAEESRAFFAPSQLASRIASCANDLSIVLELRFAATKLILGGDLPHRRAGAEVSSGWSSVVGTYSTVRRHNAFKVSHHVSIEALHPALDRVHASVDRRWVATPYNKKDGLPRFEDGEGVATSLALEPNLHLTALPVSYRRQVPMPERTERKSVIPLLRNLRAPISRFGPPVAAGAVGAPSPGECVWMIVFDDAGQVTALHRGSAGTIVVEAL